MADATATARNELRRLHRASEPEVLKPLLAAAALDADSRRRVEGRALAMLAELRAAQSKGWVNQFLQEYRLNTSEGVALLSLAEAFLRVPDPETADSLIADKLGGGDWRAHKGRSNSALVNSATWGLVIGRALTSDSEQASVLKRLIARTGEPFMRATTHRASYTSVSISLRQRTRSSSRALPDSISSSIPWHAPPRSSASISPGLSCEPRPMTERRQKLRCQPWTFAGRAPAWSTAGFHISEP